MVCPVGNKTVLEACCFPKSAIAGDEEIAHGECRNVVGTIENEKQQYVGHFTLYDQLSE